MMAKYGYKGEKFLDYTHIAKFLMNRFSNYPVSPEKEVGELSEVFRHTLFLNGSKVERNTIMLKSSESKYKSELDYPWDHYFGIELTPLLQGNIVLDLGCFTGGRSVAWFEKYKLEYLIGIDVTQTFIDAATQFADLKKIRADFKVAKGEKLLFGDDSFDAILSFDVFEHVQNVKLTLDECYRTLKPGGRLLVVFPGFYHPTEHHLVLVTRLPCIHYFISSENLIRAHYEIIEERGDHAHWYQRHSPELESWEKGNTINGTTITQFRAYLKNNNWNILLHSRKPIGSIGRHISKKTVISKASNLLYPLTFIPGLQEIFLHRITFILEKGIRNDL